MDNRNWLEKPYTIDQANTVQILPTTLKALKMIAADYGKKGIRPMWGTTQFRYLAVVARLVSIDSKLVLTDNTDMLVHQVNKLPVGPQLFIRHQYYRFVFQITPYTSDSLVILNVQVVTPGEVATHLSEMIQEELKGQLHTKIKSSRVDENEKQDVVEKRNTKKKKMIEAIAGWKNFTVQDIQQVVQCQPVQLNEILQELSEEGKIGDMGSYYFVNSQLFE